MEFQTVMLNQLSFSLMSDKIQHEEKCKSHLFKKTLLLLLEDEYYPVYESPLGCKE